MKFDKYIPAIKSRVQLFIVSTIISLYICFSYYNDYMLLDSARNDIAEWIYYNKLENNYTGWKDLQDSTSEYYKFTPSRYLIENMFPVIGEVWLYPKGSNVEIIVNEPKSIPSEPLLGPYYNSHFWKRDIKPKYQQIVADTNFASDQREALKKALTLYYSLKVDTIKQFDSWKVKDPLESNFSYEKYVKKLHLEYLATAYNISFSKTDTMPDVYHSIEKYYYENSFTVPIIDLKFPALSASWMIVVIQLLFSISLMNKLNIIRNLSNEEDWEPWTLLDVFNNLSKIISSLILVIIGLIPFITIGCLIFVFYLTNRLDGFIHSTIFYFLNSLAILFVSTLFFYSTTHIVKDLINIRQKRITVFKKLRPTKGLP